MKNLSGSKSNPIYVLGLILATFIWGVAFIAQISGGDAIEECWFNGLRFLLGGIVLIIPSLLLERKTFTKDSVKKTIVYGFFTGIMLFGAVTFQQVGIMLTRSPGISAFITDTYTLIVPVAMFLLFRKKIKLKTWLGIILATAGLYVLCILGVKNPFYQATNTIFLGEALLFVGALFFTAHVIFVDKLGGNLPTLLYCIVQFLTIGLLSICAALIKREAISLPILKASALPILYCGILSVGVAYTLQVVCQKKIDPVLCVLIFPLESVFSTLFGILFKIDKISVAFVCGSILILLGLIVSEFDFKRFFGKNEGNSIL